MFEKELKRQRCGNVNGRCCKSEEVTDDVVNRLRHF
uniref:Uncharacterized protein n=1 Tax=Rhizophora mucronata TaxID=61149 RepID=A0A2P2QH84_RHIMU